MRHVDREARHGGATGTAVRTSAPRCAPYPTSRFPSNLAYNWATTAVQVYDSGPFRAGGARGARRAQLGKKPNNYVMLQRFTQKTL